MSYWLDIDTIYIGTISIMADPFACFGGDDSDSDSSSADEGNTNNNSQNEDDKNNDIARQLMDT